MNTTTTQPIEDRVLTGLTVRTAMALLGGLVTILVSVMGTYSSIRAKIEQNTDALVEMRRVKEITDMQIKTLEVQLQAVEVRLVRLETQSERNTGK